MKLAISLRYLYIICQGLFVQFDLNRLSPFELLRLSEMKMEQDGACIAFGFEQTQDLFERRDGAPGEERGRGYRHRSEVLP